ncbi:MAG: hypothetical protein A3J24_06570 [Deltaproteobacteria bacterium RIFCSPLOWO2_02_FULL_53_8]|nr:MAG: hypothetical protein A3J24_06570 [Deltaproteobacteria bacterium RIFCSPLOWO2_02_FULL_53_8]
MFIGHYGVGLALKRYAPCTSLGTLMFAALWMDILWPLLILSGVERVRIMDGATEAMPLVFEYYPFSHSLMAAIFWAVIFATVCRLLKGRLSTALALGAGVLSHWVLDAIVHLPDLPIGFSGASFVGLGLWDFTPAAIAIEVAFFVIGLASYLRCTRPLDGVGNYGMWVFAGLLILIYAGQFAGPPPSSVTVVAYAGLAQLLIIIFGGWVDRGRRPVIR